MELCQRRLRDQFRNDVEISSETNDLEERQALVAVLDHRHRAVLAELRAGLLHSRVKFKNECEWSRLRLDRRSSSYLAPGF